MISIGMLSLVCVILFGVAVVSFSSCHRVSEWDVNVDEIMESLKRFRKNFTIFLYVKSRIN
jgi:hypothetical protein